MPQADPRARAAYQKTRLRLGILGIGLILVPAWASLALGVPGTMDAWFRGWGPWAGAGVGLVLAAATVLLQWLPDLLARRADLDLGVAVAEPSWWRQRYLPGVLRFFLSVLLGCTLVGFLRASYPGPSLYLIGLVWTLWAVARPFRDVTFPIEHEPYGVDPEWVRQVTRRLEAEGLRRPVFRWFDHGEASLAGGWEGFGSRRRLSLSLPVSQLEPAVAYGLVLREIGHRQGRHRWISLAVTVGWIGLSLAVAAAVLELAYTHRGISSTRGAAGDTLILAVVMSTMAWLSLFVLPALGRRQVLAADAFAAKRLTPTEMSQVFDALARHNLPDENLSSTKQYVFHPIPPLSVRRDRAAALKLRSRPASSGADQSVVAATMPPPAEDPT